MDDDQRFYVGQKAFINKNGSILILRDPVLGWDLPGGRISENDSNPIDALLREISEETQLTVIPGTIATSFMYKYPSNVYHQNANKYIYFVCYKCQYKSGKVILSDEHDNYKWVNMDSLQALRRSKFKQEKILYKIIEEYLENN